MLSVHQTSSNHGSDIDSYGPLNQVPSPNFHQDMNPTHDNLGQPSGITFEHQDTRGSTDRIVLYDFVLKRIRERWDNKEGRYRGEADDENDRRRGRASDAGYAFCIVKFFKPSINPNRSCVSVVIQVRSPHFVKAAEAVMEGKRDIAWKARPARVSLGTSPRNRKV